MKIISDRLLRISPFRRDRSGISAVEFALIFPLLLLLFFGGYTLADATIVHRKVSIAARTLVDLATQVSALQSSDMSTILSASTEIIAPYNAANLSILLSEITVNSTGNKATVTWSSGLNATAYKCNATFALPTNMYQANTSYLLSSVSYNYTPVVGNMFTGSLTISDSLYMLPRVSQSVSYTCPG